MTNPVTITINRGSPVDVRVHANFTDVGFTEGSDGEEVSYVLTPSEQEEALAILTRDESPYYTEHGVYDPICGPAARECADRAEANWRSERSGR